MIKIIKIIEPAIIAKVTGFKSWNGNLPILLPRYTRKYCAKSLILFRGDCNSVDFPPRSQSLKNRMNDKIPATKYVIANGNLDDLSFQKLINPIGHTSKPAMKVKEHANAKNIAGRI